MLSRADCEFAGRDRRLPDLAKLLDGDAIAEEMVSVGFGSSIEVVPDYVRYKPESSCLVGYSLAIGDLQVRVHGKIVADDQGAKAVKARSRVLRNFDCRDVLRRGGQLLLGDGRTILSFFPVDADLPSLARFHDPIDGPRLRRRIFRDDPDPPGSRLEVLAYKPERRLVGFVEGSELRRFVVRFFATSSQARASRISKFVRDGECLRIAGCVGGSKRYNISVLNWLSGSNLREAIRLDARSALESIEGVSQAIAELHDRSIVTRTELPFLDPRSGLVELALGIGCLVPARAKRTLSLAERIVSSLSMYPLENKLIHGDLYDKQIIVMRDGIGLIDLDQIGVGDPRQDLGLFLAHWERDRILGHIGSWHDEIASELVGQYERAAGKCVKGLPGFVAASLFRLVQHPFRNRLADWSRLVDANLDRVEELLEGSPA